MRHVTCDSCKRELSEDCEAHYTVKMESNKVSPGRELTDDDFENDADGDSVYEMHLMMQRDEDDAVASEDPPMRLLRKQFDFCEECYAKFSADPLGLDRVSHRRFSAN